MIVERKTASESRGDVAKDGRAESEGRMSWPWTWRYLWRCEQMGRVRSEEGRLKRESGGVVEKARDLADGDEHIQKKKSQDSSITQSL
jgi:hypothetical protein